MGSHQRLFSKCNKGGMPLPLLCGRMSFYSSRIVALKSGGDIGGPTNALGLNAVPFVEEIFLHPFAWMKYDSMLHQHLLDYRRYIQQGVKHLWLTLFDSVGLGCLHSDDSAT